MVTAAISATSAIAVWESSSSPTFITPLACVGAVATASFTWAWVLSRIGRGGAVLVSSVMVATALLIVVAAYRGFLSREPVATSALAQLGGVAIALVAVGYALGWALADARPRGRSRRAREVAAGEPGANLGPAVRAAIAVAAASTLAGVVAAKWSPGTMLDVWPDAVRALALESTATCRQLTTLQMRAAGGWPSTSFALASALPGLTIVCGLGVWLALLALSLRRAVVSRLEAVRAASAGSIHAGWLRVDEGAQPLRLSGRRDGPVLVLRAVTSARRGPYRGQEAEPDIELIAGERRAIARALVRRIDMLDAAVVGLASCFAAPLVGALMAWLTRP
jgi:hypothetical protein